MASAPLSHFADPHALLKTQYNNSSNHICDICRSKLVGLPGYRCGACDFDIHVACAEYFQKTISFFAHPWHTLTLSPVPTSSSFRWYCDLCREDCPQGHFVYRCVDCRFDVHPLCTLLPHTIRSPLHPRHDLRLVPSAGTCKCGCDQWSVWNYVCSCPLKVNIACVSGAPSSGGRSNTSSGHHAGSTAQGQGSSASQTSSSGQSAAVTRSRGSSVAKFLVKTSVKTAINAATGGLASPVL